MVMKNFEYEYGKKNESADVIIRWCRRNLGQLGNSWDFILQLKRNTVIIITKNDDAQIKFELFKND
jgi:hypothetical protein